MSKAAKSSEAKAEDLRGKSVVKNETESSGKSAFV